MIVYVCALIAIALIPKFPLVALIVLLVCLYLKHTPPFIWLIISFLIYLLATIVIMNTPPQFTSNLEYQLKVESDLQVNDNGFSFIATNSFQKVKYNYYQSANFNQKIEYGDLINVRIGDIQQIENKYNNPSSFNTVQYYYSQKVQYQVELKRMEVVGKRPNLIQTIFNTRLKILAKTNEIYSPQTSAYINALLFGDNKLELKELYSSVGIVHLFTISGTHIFIINQIIMSILAKMSSNKRLNKVLQIVILLIYSLLSGFGVSTIRAVSMIIIPLLFPQKVTKIDSYYIILTLNLLLNPLAIYNYGFVFTYLISFVLLNGNIQIENKYLSLSFQTVLATASILPFTINMNNTFNLLFILANMIFIPLVTLVLIPFSMILLIVPSFEPLYAIIINGVESVSLLLNNATIIVKHIPPIIFVVYYLLFGLICFKLFSPTLSLKITSINQFINFLRINDCLKYLKIYLIVIILIFINVPIRGFVSIIDVNQGDSILIQLPFNRGTILIDGGSEKHAKEVEKYLKYEGIATIDLLILTHMHEDHYGGLQLLTNQFEVKQVITGLTENAIEQDYNALVVQAGDVITLNKYQFNVLAPSKTNQNPNNESVVIQTKLNAKNWLFTGDIETEIETEIMNNYSNYLRDVEYLKVAHHGSKSSSSSEFLQMLNVKQAIISSGKNNKFNHPHDQTIQTLKDNQIEYLNTQQSGLVKIYF